MAFVSLLGVEVWGADRVVVRTASGSIARPGRGRWQAVAISCGRSAGQLPGEVDHGVDQLVVGDELRVEVAEQSARALAQGSRGECADLPGGNVFDRCTRTA